MNAKTIQTIIDRDMPGCTFIGAAYPVNSDGSITLQIKNTNGDLQTVTLKNGSIIQ